MQFSIESWRILDSFEFAPFVLFRSQFETSCGYWSRSRCRSLYPRRETAASGYDLGTASVLLARSEVSRQDLCFGRICSSYLSGAGYCYSRRWRACWSGHHPWSAWIDWTGAHVYMMVSRRRGISCLRFVPAHFRPPALTHWTLRMSARFADRSLNGHLHRSTLLISCSLCWFRLSC